MLTRRAILPDVERIHKLIREYSHDGTLLPRTLAELSENVRDFIVVEDRREIAISRRYARSLFLQSIRVKALGES